VISAAATLASTSPPDIASLLSDQATAEAADSVLESQTLGQEIERIEALIAFVQGAETGTRNEIRERSRKVIGDISDDVRDIWKALHPGDKAIDIGLRFHGKEQASPRLTLSEGYRNSLGLCIFLALAKREASTDRPLVLDDVVVSLDRNHRGMVVDLLEKQFTDRQILVFTHDRDWYSEMRHRLDGQRWHFKSLLPYETPRLGIRWSDRTTTFDDARAQLGDRPDGAGNDARKIMDIELALLSEKLQIRLPYLRGDRNDRRNYSDFLPRLMADGKKCLQKRSGDQHDSYTAGLAHLEEASRLLVSWGNKGSHSFDIVRPEATRLIDSCETALDVFQCDRCAKSIWFAHVVSSEWMQCQCGSLRWRYGKG
jgi:hypothetical protein